MPVKKDQAALVGVAVAGGALYMGYQESKKQPTLAGEYISPTTGNKVSKLHLPTNSFLDQLDGLKIALKGAYGTINYFPPGSPTGNVWPRVPRAEARRIYLSWLSQITTAVKQEVSWTSAVAPWTLNTEGLAAANKAYEILSALQISSGDEFLNPQETHNFWWAMNGAAINLGPLGNPSAYDLVVEEIKKDLTRLANFKPGDLFPWWAPYVAIGLAGLYVYGKSKS